VKWRVEEGNRRQSRRRSPFWRGPQQRPVDGRYGPDLERSYHWQRRRFTSSSKHWARQSVRSMKWKECERPDARKVDKSEPVVGDQHQRHRRAALPMVPRRPHTSRLARDVHLGRPGVSTSQAQTPPAAAIWDRDSTVPYPWIASRKATGAPGRSSYGCAIPSRQAQYHLVPDVRGCYIVGCRSLALIVNH